MQTTLDFVNWSANTHISSVGVCLDIPWPPGGAQAVVRLWHLIWHCSFDWRHPMRIQWRTGQDNQAEALHRLLRGRTAALTTSGDGCRIFNFDLSHILLLQPVALAKLGFAVNPVRPGGSEPGKFETDIQPVWLELFPFTHVRIAMTGGAPGPRSREITFTAFEPKVAFNRLALTGGAG